MSSAHTLNAFLKQYLEDQWSGRRRTLDEYVADLSRATTPRSRSAMRGSSATAGGSVSPARAGRRAHRPLPDLVKELGRGGQGDRLRGRGRAAGRKVALKVLDRARLADVEPRRAVPARGRGRLEARSSRHRDGVRDRHATAASRSSRCGSWTARRSRRGSAGRSTEVSRRAPDVVKLARHRREGRARAARRARGRRSSTAT